MAADDTQGHSDGRLKSEAMEQLATTIEGLPSELRTVFILRYVKRTPSREIARRLEQSLSEVQGLLARSLSECQEQLRSRGIDLAEFALPFSMADIPPLTASRFAVRRWFRQLARYVQGDGQIRP